MAFTERHTQFRSVMLGFLALLPRAITIFLFALATLLMFYGSTNTMPFQVDLRTLAGLEPGRVPARSKSPFETNLSKPSSFCGRAWSFLQGESPGAVGGPGALNMLGLGLAKASGGKGGWLRDQSSLLIPPVLSRWHRGSPARPAQRSSCQASALCT